MNAIRGWNRTGGARAGSMLAILLVILLALTTTACGGGGNVRTEVPVPPVTPTPPTGLDFTPTVQNDASLVVNPPSIPVLGAPLALANNSLNRHLILTNAAGALGAGLKGQGVTIGFVDSGVNRNHPTLAGRVTRHFVHVNPNTNNTSVDDVVGHGTVVASLAAGRPASGIYSGGETGTWGGGVAQDALVVSSRIIADQRPDDDGSGEGNEIHAGEGYGDFFAAINEELASAGARIINNSWGGLYWNDPALSTELANAWRQFVVGRGGIVVFANGNSGDDPRFADDPSDNAALPSIANDPVLEKGWLTVGALDPANPTQLTSYSQRCGIAMQYCLVAPGNVVFINPAATSQANSHFYQGGGTSYAAPLVSGAAAVVWAAFPYFSNDQVRQAILGGATDLGAPGVDAVFGWGLLDVTRAAMGPSTFAWGDFSVSFSGNSVWRNPITGSGGLIKDGSGILTLAEEAMFSGDTRVNAGGLDVRKGLASDLSIAGAGTVWASGRFGGDVANSGRLLNRAGAPASIDGNFSQTATGNLGVWLGSKLTVAGTANLSGTMSILGVTSGYTTSATETLLTANGGVSGTFSSLRAASNVFLDASLAYDPNNVFLNINRIDVSRAVAAMGIGGIAAASAARVEAAMRAIDGQLGGIESAGAGGNFIDAAGALQRSTNAANAEASLRSLSGQLHGSGLALTLDGIDLARRHQEARIDRFASTSPQTGGWYRQLAASSASAQSGFDGVAMESSGMIIGHDWRAGQNAVVGMAVSKQVQSAWLDGSGDRSDGHQQDATLYAAGWHGSWQASARLSSGTYEREMHRGLLLGSQRDQAATRLTGDYLAFSGDIGRRFAVGALTLVPYAGSQYVQIGNNGFSESGTTGFGLRATAWETRLWQAFAGLRAHQGWRLADLEIEADARLEWRDALSSSGLDFDASYVGVDQWSALSVPRIDTDGMRGGIGVTASSGGNSLLRFELGWQQSRVQSGAGASLRFMRHW